jgi:hypothetical protein
MMYVSPICMWYIDFFSLLKEFRSNISLFFLLFRKNERKKKIRKKSVHPQFKVHDHKLMHADSSSSCSLISLAMIEECIDKIWINSVIILNSVINRSNHTFTTKLYPLLERERDGRPMEVGNKHKHLTML